LSKLVINRKWVCFAIGTRPIKIYLFLLTHQFLLTQHILLNRQIFAYTSSFVVSSVGHVTVNPNLPLTQSSGRGLSSGSGPSGAWPRGLVTTIDQSESIQQNSYFYTTDRTCHMKYLTNNKTNDKSRRTSIIVFYRTRDYPMHQPKPDFAPL